MDCACYDSTDNLIIGVRGGRVYKCDPSTGSILTQVDYQQVSNGPATIVWEPASNRCFVACWNTGNFITASASGLRTLYRIVPSTLATDMTADFATLFGTVLNSSDWEGGIASLRTAGGNLYGTGWKSTISPLWNVFKFSNVFGGASFRQIGASGPSQSFAYVSVGGTNDVVFWPSQNGRDVESWDFTGAAFNSSIADGTKGFVGLEYQPATVAHPVDHFYVTRQLQFIDRYSSANPPVYIDTINTARSAFNGVGIRYNSVDGLVYVAGGSDNTVVVINPATNTFVVKTGFDLPVEFVFTGSKKFAVQQGSSPLKEIV